VSQHAYIPPGATIGILGGGQLGRMTAMAARTLGYRVHALDPDKDCAAGPVVDKLIVASFDDARAAETLARECAVVTLEIEKISLASLEAAARHAPVRPGKDILHVIQDKGRQKAWLQKEGFPVGPWALATSAEELASAYAQVGPRTFVKGCTGGYDGRGQVRVDKPSGTTEAWTLLGSTPVVVEQAVELAGELSVLVVRGPEGNTTVYPPSWNDHVAQILDVCLMPAELSPALESQAQALGLKIAEALKLEGILAVELFLTRDNRLWVNELAPRPHTTFHTTELACATSQFEQLVRAVTGLPLGLPTVLKPAAVANLLGDLWMDSKGPPRFDEALKVPGTRLHLYGKGQARPGRKMGHLSALGDTGAQALERVREARRRLLP
jgi:5-(carboxyamino)imidazole ribonucleotide synthase